MEKVVPLAAQIQVEIVNGDGKGAVRTAAELAAYASSATSLTSDPVWRALEFVPVLGANLTAVRELAAVVDDVSRNSITPLVVLADTIELADFKPVGGSIDLEPLVQARPRVALVNEALAKSMQALQAIQTDETLDVIRNAADRLEAAVTEASGMVTTLDRAVRLAPNMLGAAGPRNYVLLFQNPAELRATGGIAGAVAMLHMESGTMELAQQASSGDFPVYPTPVLTLPTETRGIFGDITGKYIQDVNLTPNFPLSAQLAREMWNREFGVVADGVISIDPVALSYLLTATGPITLPTGDVLSAENAVQLLLVDAYARYENPADQDAFFAAAAASVFSAVSGGDVDPVALITALARAGEERRVIVWNADEAEQAVLAGTTLAGGLPLSDADAQRFGLYLNDATGAKMDTYLDVNTTVGQVTCRNDKRPNYAVEVTLTNTAPADAGLSLPQYVTGGGVYGVEPGNVKTIVSVYGTSDVQNLGVIRDGQAAPYHPATDQGYQVSSVTVDLSPGQSTVIRYDWLGNSLPKSSVELEMTPVIHRNETQKLEIAC
ncbi:DUF4012 domain-containing protein [Cryobacterium sp. W22_MBD10_FK3]|uniref:DUF4012 domain-containing protein n=1 Tax=Cryobacterium sp. W22_MBD10_FK3 TaxID=3240273 RepID=UPI003F90D2EA